MLMAMAASFHRFSGRRSYDVAPGQLSGNRAINIAASNRIIDEAGGTKRSRHRSRSAHDHATRLRRFRPSRHKFSCIFDAAVARRLRRCYHMAEMQKLGMVLETPLRALQ
jgi:hypothetical protein